MEKLWKLYIKESPFGMLYLGISKRKGNSYKYYRGSGIRWNNHLEANKVKVSQITTYTIFQTDSYDELIEKGKFYSKVFNVVENKKWANLVEENGGIYSHWTGKKNPKHSERMKVIMKGHKHSSETIEKLKEHRESHFKKGNVPYNAKNNPVIQYSLSGEFIREWDGVTYASKGLKQEGVMIDAANITACAKGRYKQTNGFIFKYKKDI